MCLLLFFGCLPTVFRPRGAVFTCGADIYLRCYRLHGGCGFEYTSGGSCGRACNTRPRIGTSTCGATDIYLRCFWDVYLRWLLHRAWQDACHLENYLRCYRLHGGCEFEYTSGGSCGRACNVPPIDLDIYLRCKNISYRARYRPLAKSERKAQGRKGHTKTAEEHGAKGD